MLNSENPFYEYVYMNALEASFGFRIADGGTTLALDAGKHFRFYPIGKNERFGLELAARQIDLIRIATSIHVADGFVRRTAARNGHRSPSIEIEVLDLEFWSHPDVLVLLKECVDFLSGDDDWDFRFVPARNARHSRRPNLFRGYDCSALICLYSGGLDSAAGLAARLAEVPGRMVVPVTVRHQMQKTKLVAGHFRMLVERDLAKPHDMLPFEAGAFVRNGLIKYEFGFSSREVTHRCRPMLFMSLAGLVADSYGAKRVEIFESGVGSLNLPLRSGPADFRTTRSTHPRFLRLISTLVSRVNEVAVEYVLPFASLTKAEVVARLAQLGLEELACKSISCTLHPLRRLGWQQCGHCPACVYRRQALITAGISEPEDAYAVDLFSPAYVHKAIPEKQMRVVRAFHQQIERLSQLDAGFAPRSLIRYLRATRAISTDEELSRCLEVHRRYTAEWLAIIADARDRGLPWIAQARSLVFASGATS